MVTGFCDNTILRFCDFAFAILLSCADPIFVGEMGVSVRFARFLDLRV